MVPIRHSTGYCTRQTERETDTIYQFVILELLGVDAVGVVDAAVVLDDPDALGTGACQITTAM